MEKMSKTRIISFHIPENILETLDRLVEMGIFNNRSEAIRLALIKFITNDMMHYIEVREKMMQVGYR